LRRDGELRRRVGRSMGGKNEGQRELEWQWRKIEMRHVGDWGGSDLGWEGRIECDCCALMGSLRFGCCKLYYKSALLIS